MYQKAPASYRVDQLSAEVFETQGKYTEAIAEYRKAIAKNPKGVNLHYCLGRALLQQSHDPAALEEARKEFEAELKLNPSDAVAEYQIAQILSARQKKPEAAAHFRQGHFFYIYLTKLLRLAVAPLRADRAPFISGVNPPGHPVSDRAAAASDFFLRGHMSAPGEIKAVDEPAQRDELAVKAKASPQVRPRSA